MPEDAAFGDRPNAASIQDNEATCPHAAFATMPVTRETGKLRNQGGARTRHTVEQGGLTNVGASHQSNHGFHAKAQLTPTMTKLPLPVCTSTPCRVATGG